MRASRRTSPRGAAASRCARTCSTHSRTTASRCRPDKRARMSAIARAARGDPPGIRTQYPRQQDARRRSSPDEVKGLPQRLSRQGAARRQGQLPARLRVSGIPAVHGQRRERGCAPALPVRLPELAARRGTSSSWPRSMRLRREMAGLFGLSSYAQFATRRRMVANPQTVEKFLATSRRAVRDVERKELAELTALKADLAEQAGRRSHAAIAGTSTSTRSKLKKARYSVDQEALRKYFPTEASIQWVMAISTQPLRRPLRAGHGADLAPGRAATSTSSTLARPASVKRRHLPRSVSSRRQVQPRGGVRPCALRAAARARTPISVLVANFNRIGTRPRRARDAGARIRPRDARRPLRHPLRDAGGTQRRARFRRSAVADVRGMGAAPANRWRCCRNSASPPARRSTMTRLEQLSTARLYGAGMRYSRQHLYAAYDMATSGDDRSRAAGAVGNDGRRDAARATFREPSSRHLRAHHQRLRRRLLRIHVVGSARARHVVGVRR